MKIDHKVTPKVVSRLISELIPADYNPRKISEKDLKQLCKSLETFSAVEPALINTHPERSNIIIGGHQRLKAATSLGWTEFPCIELELTLEQERELNVRLNRNTGEWDYEALLRGWNVDDLIGFGFDADELPIKEVVGETDPDAVPELPEEPITQPGWIYQLGDHRLMCGDSTDAGSVALLMDGQKAQMVFTDPPYGVEYQSNMRTKSEKFEVIANDDQFLDIAPIIEMFSTGWVFVWTSWKVQNRWIDVLNQFGYPTNIIIWHKPGGGIGDLKRTFLSDYEVALVWHRETELVGKRIGSVWTINKDVASTYVHPTQKPVALAEEAMDKTARRGALVLDLFGGSGSTLIACEKAGRCARLMELDPKYCDVIVKRWEEFTGKKAVKL